MKYNSFELVHVKELSSMINRDIDIDSESLKKIQTAYRVIFQYQDGNDSVGLHVQIRYVTFDEKVLLEIGATFVVRLLDWNESAHDEQSIRDNQNIVNLVGYGLAFVCGMTFRHTSGTILNTVFTPYINPGNIMKDVIIEKV